MKFGDVVSYIRGPATVNALVVQSVVKAGIEELTIVYLDPAAASPLLSGSNVQKAIATAFVQPLADGKTYGWKELTGPAYGPLSPEDQAVIDAATKGNDLAVAELRKVAGELQMANTDNANLREEIASLHAKLAEIEKEAADQNPTTGAEPAPTSESGPTHSESTQETSTETPSPTDQPSQDHPSGDTSKDPGPSEPQQ